MLRFLRRLLLAGGIVASLILGVQLAHAWANTASPWLTSLGLDLQKQVVVPAPPTSINGNIDCQKDNSASCVLPTLYGSASSGGAVELNGTSDYRPVVNYIDGHEHFIAIPNSSTAISYISAPAYGLYLYFNYNLSGSITTVDSLGGPQYQINRPPDGVLADMNNHRLAADYSSMSFSQNGRWMIISDPNVAMLRVNLETFQVTPFAPGFNYTIGLDPGLQTAISNDGRYAVVASKNFNRFSIYDLDTCAAAPTTIDGPVTCQSRDMESFMAQQVDGYVNTSNIRFIDDDTLSLYASYAQNASLILAKFILSETTGSLHQLNYMALGDSYISGEGAFDYETGTDTHDNTCHVSQLSYPYLLGYDLNFNSYHSVACSGAVTGDIINAGEDYPGQVKNGASKKELAKDNQIPPILNNFQPGYIDQLDFVSTYHPKIVTVSIGGNDIGFSARLQACLGLGTCYNTYEDRLEFVREVNGKFNTLVNTYNQIKNAGVADARIYVIGYPQIAKVGGDCADNVRMNNDELIFAQQAIDYLDTVIKAAADRAGVDYVDTQAALVGHRLCEAGPSSVAMNGVTAGNDFPDKLGGPIGRESYHPNVLGHQLLENAILSATHNLTAPMPAVDLGATPPAESGLNILDAPKSGRPVNVAEYDPNISDDVMSKESPNDVSIDGSNHALQPSTTLQASLHSEPVTLGSYSTDSSGDLTAQITIPDSIPAGYHTLHFYGSDITGQPIDIYKVIYIADSTKMCVSNNCNSQAEQPLVSANTVAAPDSGGPTSGSSVKPAADPQPKVLSDKIIAKSSDANGRVQLLNQSPPAYLKLLIGANIAGIFVAMSYALWKFRG